MECALSGQVRARWRLRSQTITEERANDRHRSHSPGRTSCGDTGRAGHQPVPSGEGDPACRPGASMRSSWAGAPSRQIRRCALRQALGMTPEFWLNLQAHVRPRLGPGVDGHQRHQTAHWSLYLKDGGPWPGTWSDRLTGRVSFRKLAGPMDEHKTRGERREARRRKRRKMRVSGRSVRTIQEIIRRRAERIAGKSKEEERP